MTKVAIIGAGIGGLASALALLKRGVEVEVFEQAEELREVGAGVTMFANGLRVLFALGLETEVRKSGVLTPEKQIRLWNTGKAWPLIGLDKTAGAEAAGLSACRLHRADLQSMLMNACIELKEDAIRLNHKFVDFSQDDEQVRIFFSNGKEIVTDVLIGADGLHSAVRESLFGAVTPRFSGQMAWRGLARMEDVPVELRRAGVAATWIGPHAHITSYPVSAGRFFNFVGQVDRSDWQHESWFDEGSREECLHDFAGWHADIHRVIQNIPKLYKWGLFLREPLRQWTVDRVTLLGDASHAMLPYLGQGANTALEDGYILARCLEEFELLEALRRYEAARIDRTARIVEASAAMVETFHAPELSNPVDADVYVQKTWNSNKVSQRYQWIHSYNATGVEI